MRVSSMLGGVLAGVLTVTTISSARAGGADFALSDDYRGSVGFMTWNASGTLDPIVPVTSSDGIDVSSAGVGIGDFNGDGLIDFVNGGVASDHQHRVFFHGRASASAEFEAGVDLANAAGSWTDVGDFAIADYDRDGKLDFAVSLADFGQVQVFLGNGDGTFKSPTGHSVPFLSYGLDSEDVNGDGNADFVASRYYDDAFTYSTDKQTHAIAIYLGDGSGAFAEHAQVLEAPTSVPAFDYFDSLGLALGDFDCDAKVDVVLTNLEAGRFEHNLVAFYRGNGDGTFGSAPVLSAPAPVGAIDYNGDTALHLCYTSIDDADFNGDGKQDIVLTNPSGSGVLVYLGNGDGTFALHDAGPITFSRGLPGSVFGVSTLPYSHPLPTASAGPDQAVSEGETVVLDGSGSVRHDSRPLTYAWTQVAGTPVSLELRDAVHPTFVAPAVAIGGETLTFKLTVSNGTQTSAPDAVDIVVKNVNHAPLADAGDDVAVSEGTLVTLDGSQSFDPDSDALTYDWRQAAGAAVTLSDPSAARPTFTAPDVGPAGETLTFELTVGDGAASAQDAVSVRDENVNQRPVAAAGNDQTVSEATFVRLDASPSSDPDGDALGFRWAQSSGPEVSLSDAGVSSPTFTAPQVGMGGTDLVFDLVVNDGFLDSASDEVSVHVMNMDDPPICSLAAPTVASLWPPDHKLVLVSITGVTDPNDDAVIVSIVNVTEDEPVSGLADGDTSPDAVVQGASVLLRAERSGTGNGRVYRVTYRADDGQGGACTGTVNVSVPHDRKATSVDSGGSHDALAQ